MALEGAIAALSSGDDSPEQKPSQAGPLSGAIAALSSPVSDAPTLKAVPKPSGPVMTGEDPGPGMAEAALQTVSGIGSSIIGGWRGLATLAGGGSADEAAQAVKEEQDKRTYQPTTESGKRAVTMLASPVNPMNWPAMAGQRVGDALAENGQPLLGAAAVTAATAAPLLFLRGGKSVTAPEVGNTSVADAFRPKPLEAIQASSAPAIDIPAYMRKGQPVEATPSTSPSATPVATPAATFADAPAVPGGVPVEAQGDRAAVLQRIGLPVVRKSAITGDPLNAATDFQTSKFNEPAGEAAKAQFQAERTALQNHAESIVQDTGGSLGLDEDALQARGQAIAKPFDDLRNWFEQAKGSLYKSADEQAKGAPAVIPENINKLMADPDFEQTMIAKGQESLYGAIKKQFTRFGELNPEGVTVENAEKFRKWLNSAWTPQNSSSLAQVKAALDDDVFRSAGGNIYQQARQMHILEKKTLDNPSGAAKLLDFDPQTPINRVTSFDKIPDTLARLSPDQFNHIVATLKDVPAELQPQANAALSEIRAHFANKLLDTGNKYQTQWNAPGVTKFLNDNASKMRLIFGDDPVAMQKISDLQRGGTYLKVDTSYPGAAAQASNASKRGLLTNIIRPAGAVAGEAVGSFFGVPGVGTAMGDIAGGKLAGQAGERAALKNWQRRVIPLSEVGK